MARVIVLSRSVASAIVVMVSIMYFGNFVLSAIPVLGYKSDPLIHGAFLAITGGAFAMSRKQPEESKSDPPAGRHTQ